MKNLVCWRCGASLEKIELPFRRLEQCPECRGDLRVCRMCESYAPRLDSKCDDVRADGERDPELANFCDYFKPCPRAHEAKAGRKSQESKSELLALFGMEETEGETASSPRKARAEADAARKKLEELFGSDNNDQSKS